MNPKQSQGLIAALQQAAVQAAAQNGTQRPSTLPAAAPQTPSTLPAAAAQKPVTLPANVSQIPGDFPPKTPIGMCYVPFQQWETPLAENIGFEAGTIFPGLVLPFSTSKGCAVQ
jgi:hypothetical protein